jgi:FSR family fosmidomycin resistance protein-like MFS transporter
MAPQKRDYGILLSICTCHAINDMLQSLLAAVYPTLKSDFDLSFGQIGAVTLAYQLTASLLQPLVGVVSDRRPMPFSLPAGTIFTFVGLILLSVARSYPELLAGACVLGVGSSVFHPESSRVAAMASRGRPGLGQSLFQVGGNVGATLGPVGAAIVVLRWGRHSLAVFAGMALISTVILGEVGTWYGLRIDERSGTAPAARASALAAALPSRSRTSVALGVLLLLIFSRFAYLSSFTSYYTFYLMHRFGVSLRQAQFELFAFLAATAAGTLAGGPLGDRFGRKAVIWVSMLGALPLTLCLPFAGFEATRALSSVIAFVLALAFPAIVVYGQELLPHRVGMVSGLFFGLAFGAAGCGAALLGTLADTYGIEVVYRVCALLPALGFFAALLPDVGAAPQGSAALTSAHVAPVARRTE